MLLVIKIIGGAMMSINRISEMLEYLRVHKSAKTRELADYFNVSPNTIRRDTEDLVDRHLVEKVHGGVILKTDYIPTPYRVRNIKLAEEKDNIAKIAASYIEDGDFIFIDAGTTTRNILKYVNKEISFTLITNNLDIIIAASQNDNIDLFITGNKYNKSTSSFLNGTNSPDSLSCYTITKAFMAATGVSINEGLTNYHMEEIPIKRTISKQSNMIFLLADNSKFDSPSLISYSKLDVLDYIITDIKPTQRYIRFADEHNIDILY